MTPSEFEGRMQAAAQEIAHPAVLLGKVKDVAVRNAKQRAPKRTGALAASVSGQVATQSISMTASAPYAGFVEEGTSRMKAQPFLHPGVEESASEIEGLMQQFGESVLAKVGS